MTVLDLLQTSLPFFTGTCLVLGLIVGSFLNVVIYRVPVMLEREWREQCAELARNDAEEAGRHAPAPPAGTTTIGTTPPGAPPPGMMPSAPFNLAVPRSACPSCAAPITALQNIPIMSYLFLKGRCARCGTPISGRYPLIEALTGLLSAGVAWRFGFGVPALGALVLTWFLIALAVIDIDHQLLPDRLTLPLLWIGLLLSLWGSAGSTVPVDVRSSVIGAIAGYLSLWSVYHVFRLTTGREGMGYGDFKLFAALGAWMGWRMLLPIVLIAAGGGAVIGIILLKRRGKSTATPIAFGPFLAAAGWIMLMFGQALVEGYLGMFAPRP
jgi:leader peptidase (prepilin peptidase)/N-methyltransferase